jgi:hypothetical protein
MPDFNETKNVLLFTGHLIDAAGRQKIRFPADLVEHVRSLMITYLDEEYRLQKPDIAVTSLGSGGDILFADGVLKRGTPLVIFLPFENERFIKESVGYVKDQTDEKPDFWELEFERIIKKADKVFYTNENDTTENPFAHCNEKMVEYALDAAQEDINSISVMALLRPEEEAVKGGTSHFVNQLKSRNFSVQVIWPEREENVERDINRLNLLIPVFAKLDASASYYQGKWKKRLKAGLIILGVIAFSEAFVNISDELFWGYGDVVRLVTIIIALGGIFITLQMQLSDKTSFGEWTQNRAKAEQIRSEIWYYLFNIKTENNRFGSYGESEFEQYIRKLKPYTWHGYVINLKRMIRIKQFVLLSSLQDKAEFYLKNRLRDQLQYFTNKHLYFKKRIILYKAATYLFLIISVTWGTLMLLSEFFTLPSLFVEISPVGTMISFIALVSTYAESNNSKEMEYKYKQMANGIESLNKRRESISDLAGFESFVKECESFLRTQNNEWSLERKKMI